MVHTSPFTYLAWLAKKKYGVKCCLFDHGEPIRYEDFRLLYPKLIERIYAMVMCESIYLPVKKFDYFITNSLFSANILRNRLGVEDIAIIYPKIDESKFNEKLDGKVVREKYKLEDNPLLLFVGRIVPSKGIHLLIEAFKLVRQKIPNAKLIIVGDTSYKNYFLKLKSLVDDSIIFAGYVPDEELPQYYAACDLYVTCSLWEGFNRPLAEAKMCHKPVVAFDIGPHKEVHVNGLLVRVGDIKKFADSIIEVISNSKDE
jgi:1,2-diacylglycerol 3-alpha-glucosyltransferase